MGAAAPRSAIIVVQPLDESRSEVAIVFDLATRLGLGEHFFNSDIEAAYNYELASSGLKESSSCTGFIRMRLFCGTGEAEVLCHDRRKKRG